MTEKDSELNKLVIETVNAGNSITVTVTGQSMTPLFRDKRDTVTLAPKPEKLKRGDMIYYVRNDIYLLHRIIKKNKKGIFCAGDAYTKLEPPVQYGDVIAKVIEYTRKGKVRQVRRFSHRLYSWFWRLIRPFRRIIINTGYRLKYGKKADQFNNR